MDTRGTCWSITINNPTEADKEGLNIALQKGWKPEGQQEKGVNGVLHYQLMLKTPQVRFSAVKKVFPRAHIELARNVSALAQYVHKEETKVDDLPLSSERYPSLTKYWDLVYQYCLDNLLLDMDTPADPRWYRVKNPNVDPLKVLDEASAYLIRMGYHVECIAVNPQTRCSFQKFSEALFRRAYVDRQTDRQTSAVEKTNSDNEHNQNVNAS